MQDLVDYARKNGITSKKKGHCQFCGAAVSGGVFECLDNAHHIGEVLDFNNPAYQAETQLFRISRWTGYALNAPFVTGVVITN